MNVAQELYCHNCGKYVQFSIDTELEGKHILNCPSCNHEHFRIVRDGVITEDRWGSANRNVYYVPASTISVTNTSTYSTSSSGSYFVYQSWSTATISIY